MHRPHAIRRMVPLFVRKLRYIDLERRVSVAHEYLPQVAQAVLDVLERMRAVRQKADADDVEAVQLVVERNKEGAVCGAETDETARGEERAPLVVVVERKVVLARFETQASEGELDGQLRGEVISYVSCDGRW